MTEWERTHRLPCCFCHRSIYLFGQYLEYCVGALQGLLTRSEAVHVLVRFIWSENG